MQPRRRKKAKQENNKRKHDNQGRMIRYAMDRKNEINQKKGRHA